MGHPNEIKRRRSWFHRRLKENQSIDPAEQPEKVTKEAQLSSEPPVDHSSPKSEKVDTSWIEDEEIQRSIAEFNNRLEKGSSEMSSKTDILESLLKELVVPEEIEEPAWKSSTDEVSDCTEHNSSYSSSVSRSSLQLCHEPSNSSLPRRVALPTHSTLGPSVTPLRIRDNLHHLLHTLQSEYDIKDLSYEERKQTQFLQNMGMDRSVRSVNISKLCTFSGVPSSRLALLDNNQCSAFLYQLQKYKSHASQYSYYFSWMAWCEKIGSRGKKLIAEAVIDTNIDFEQYMKSLKKRVSLVDHRFHLLKLNFLPKRKSQRMINGGTIDIQVSINEGYEMFKELGRLVMEDTLYKPRSIQRKYNLI